MRFGRLALLEKFTFLAHISDLLHTTPCILKAFGAFKLKLRYLPPPPPPSRSAATDCRQPRSPPHHSYRLVMSWENPALSSISLLSFVYLSLVANAEYLLALLPFSLLVFMTLGFLSRRSGGYVQGWIQSGEGGVGVGVKPSDTTFR